MTAICFACGSAGVHDPDIDGLSRCPQCGLRWETVPPSPEALSEAYQRGFYEAAPARGGRLVQRFHAFNSTLRLREVSDLPPGRLVDLGCGKGHFVAAARAAGWDAIGTDSSQVAAGAAKELYGIEIAVGDLVDVPLDGPFDVATMWHVLEHVHDPAQALARAHDLLIPGGRLVVSVPNVASLQARIFGAEWFHLDRQHHLHHFTPAALRTLLERSGFHVARIGYLYPEMEAIGFVQSVLNRAGLDRDALYRFLKRDRTIKLDRALLASAGLAMLAAPIGLGLAVTMPLTRSGASMQFVATARR